MFCKNCGVQISGESMFCKRCGVKQNIEGESVTTKTAEPILKKQKVSKEARRKTESKKKVLHTIAGFVLLFITVAVYLFTEKKAVYLAPVRELEKALNTADADMLYDAFIPSYGDVLENIIGQEEVKEQLKIIQSDIEQLQCVVGKTKKIKKEDIQGFLKENIYDVEKEVYLEELKDANKCIVVSLEIAKVSKGAEEGKKNELGNVPIVELKGNWYLVPTNDFFW